MKICKILPNCRKCEDAFAPWEESLPCHMCVDKNVQYELLAVGGGGFYTFNSLYGESDVVRIVLLNEYGHNKENYDLCQRCMDKLMKWLEGNKKDRITFVVHTVSDYDLSQAHENILTSLSCIPGVFNMPHCIDIPGVEIFFRCGDPETCLGGLRPDYYVSNSVSGLEFLRQSAEKCGGERLKDIDELCNKVIELVNSFCR